MAKSKKKNLKVRDLKPRKDAKGGGHPMQGSVLSSSALSKNVSSQNLSSQNLSKAVN